MNPTPPDERHDAARVTDTTAPAAGRRLPPSLAAELLEQSLSCVPTIDLRDVGARLLAPLVNATQATRASLMLVNPDTGKLRIVAALGLSRELIGHDVEWRPSSISEWVFRKRQGLVLNGAVKQEGLVGTAGNNVESAMCVPLEVDDQVIGVLNLASGGHTPPFHDEVMEALVAILPPVAAAVERALHANMCSRNTEQLVASRGLVGRTLLKPGLYEGRNYEMGYARLSCSREGGAACERVPLPTGGHVLMAVDPRADGLEALLAVAFAQGVFAALAPTERSASAIVARINTELCTRLPGHGEMGIWIGLLSPSGQVTSCAAGYAPPLWLPGDDTPVAQLQSGGAVVGADPSGHWDEETVRLLPGDVLAAVSSGVLGARNVTAQPFGPSRIEESIRERRRQPMDAVADGLVRGVLAWSGRPVPIADLCALTVRFSPGN